MSFRFFLVKENSKWIFLSSSNTGLFKIQKGIVCLFFWQDNYVITGCGDSTIRVIDITTGKLAFTFMGHGGSVDYIQVIGSYVISAGTDRLVIIL